MKKHIVLVISVIGGLSFFLAAGCASSRARTIKSVSNLYAQSYDQVFAAVKDMLFNDMNCFCETEDRDSGVIETGWVHTMDMDGYRKWRITARIRKKKNGVFVEIDKLEQVKKEPRKQIGLYAEDRMKHQARNTAEASTWRTLELDRAAVENMHQNLRTKLNE